MLSKLYFLSNHQILVNHFFSIRILLQNNSCFLQLFVLVALAHSLSQIICIIINVHN